MRIRVTTFNIQHGRDHRKAGDVIDVPLMARAAAETEASIIGFNEVRRGTLPGIPGFPDTPAMLAEEAGGEVIFGKAISLGRGMDYGNALLTKHRIIESEIIPIPDPGEDEREDCFESRCVIRALLDVGGKEVTVLSTHFGLSAAERENAAETVLGAAEKTKTPVILMGDLNAEPDDPVCRRIRAAFTDAAAALGKEEDTFPSDRPEKRIDYIFLRGCVPVEIHTVKRIVSDHFALTAETEI